MKESPGGEAGASPKECPHCGEVHEISVRETYINGARQRPISLGHLGSR
jgi:hypothetical protein